MMAFKPDRAPSRILNNLSDGLHPSTINFLSRAKPPKNYMTNRFIQTARVEPTAVIKLDESEMRALDALAGYGIQPFLDVFYRQMDKTYMEPHEAGLRSLFEAIQAETPRFIKRCDSARKVFNEP